MKKMLFIIACGLFLNIQVGAAPKCIFGEDLEELGQLSRFSIEEDVIRTFKIPRINLGSKKVRPSDLRPVIYSVDVIQDKETKRVFHLNTTFRDSDDGGNTIGWIEEVTDAENEMRESKNTGRVVAKVGDSSFYDCTVEE